MKKYFLFSMVVFTLFSCKSNTEMEVELKSHAWNLVNSDAINAPLNGRESYTIDFSKNDTTVSGIGACNRYFGSYALKANNKIKIDIKGATMMACPNLNEEQSYFMMMDSVDAFKIENDTLKFMIHKNVIAQFINAEAFKDIHTAQNSLDYIGTYTGTFPAADCPGINVELVLNKDYSYTQSMDYIDRNTKFTEKGKFTVEGNILTLMSNDMNQYYKVGENKLTRLDSDKQPVTGPMADMYILKK